MRIVRGLVSLALLSMALVQAQSSPLHGVEVADINRGTDPCADFYEFANGRDGAGGGPQAKRRKIVSTRYSIRPRPCRINPRGPSIS